MKNYYTIGRDPQCDIVVYDATNIVSRSHATLRIQGRKMFLTDHSTNGTFVNGMKIASNVEYQVTRQDDVSFGNIVYLDWDSVPSGSSNRKTIVIIVLSLLVTAILSLLGYFLLRNDDGEIPQQDKTPVSTNIAIPASDSTSKSEEAKDSLVVLPNVKATAKQPAKTVDNKSEKKKPVAIEKDEKSIQSGTSISKKFEEKENASKIVTDAL